MRFFKYTEMYDADTFLKLFQALRIGLDMFLNVKHRKWQKPSSLSCLEFFVLQLNNANIIFKLLFTIMT
jgi:hypothetical protein